MSSNNAILLKSEKLKSEVKTPHTSSSFTPPFNLANPTVFSHQPWV